MKNLVDAVFFPIGVALWIPLLLLRGVLVVVGWFVVPFTDAKEHPIWGNRVEPVPSRALHAALQVEERWLKVVQKFLERYEVDFIDDWYWRAFRNPTNNLRFLVEEPKDPWYIGDKDPDFTARVEGKFSWRLIGSGIWVEFWMQWPTRYVRGHQLYREFRIGFKYGRTPGFGLTLQPFREGR